MNLYEIIEDDIVRKHRIYRVEAESIADAHTKYNDKKFIWDSGVQEQHSTVELRTKYLMEMLEVHKAC